MGDLLTTGSVLAAFFAGGVALFAPCCIVFLAPSYLAVAVKNRRRRLLPLTFIFAAGLGLVLIPITLGVSLVAGTIAHYHEPLYYAGGALMLALAVFTCPAGWSACPRSSGHQTPLVGTQPASSPWAFSPGWPAAAALPCWSG